MRGGSQQGPEKGQRWGPGWAIMAQRLGLRKVKPGCVSVADMDKASNGSKTFQFLLLAKDFVCDSKQPQPGCRGPALGGREREEFSSGRGKVAESV